MGVKISLPIWTGTCYIAASLHLESPNETRTKFHEMYAAEILGLVTGPVQNACSRNIQKWFQREWSKKNGVQQELKVWKLKFHEGQMFGDPPWYENVGFHTWQTHVVCLALAQCEASWVFGGRKIDTKMWRTSSSHSKLKFLEVDHELKIQQDNLAQFPVHPEIADLPWLTSRKESQLIIPTLVGTIGYQLSCYGVLYPHILQTKPLQVYVPSKSLNFWCRIMSHGQAAWDCWVQPNDVVGVSCFGGCNVCLAMMIDGFSNV